MSKALHTFRTNTTPTGDVPTWTESTIAVERVQRYNVKMQDKTDNVAKIFLAHDAPVGKFDEVKFDGRWCAFGSFYDVCFLSGAASHIEIEVKAG